MLARSWGDSIPPDAALHVPADQPDDLIAQAFRTGKNVLEVEVDPASQGVWYQSGCAVLATPLVAQRQVTGVIVVQDPSPHGLQDRSQQDFVKSAASQAAIALENAAV